MNRIAGVVFGMVSGLLAMLVMGSPSAWAATRPQPSSYATVAVVQMPAWLEHGGQTQPLTVGMPVRNGDRIRTGTDARVYLALAEGSTVKLGENASLGLYSRSLKPVSNFKGALDVLSGAFRFTTAAAQRLRGQRELNIRIGTATIGIRGTDVWGKSDAERDLVLLIEGKIEVRHGDGVYEMGEPLSTFSVARQTATESVAAANPQQVALWAQETDVMPGHGVVQPGGKWRVTLASFSSQPEALAAYDKARAAGYAAQVKVRPAGAGQDPSAAPVEKGAQWAYAVVVSGLADRQEALALADKINRQLGFAAQAEK